LHFIFLMRGSFERKLREEARPWGKSGPIIGHIAILYSTSPRNGNPANGNHLEICLLSSRKNRNSLTWVLVALTVSFTYPVLR
jgi:hypothetical protein